MLAAPASARWRPVPGGDNQQSHPFLSTSHYISAHPVEQHPTQPSGSPAGLGLGMPAHVRNPNRPPSRPN